MSEITVPWSDVVRFVRQLNHDIRNHLNALELQAALLNEIATDAEVKGEVKRLRETLSTVANTLQKLSTKLGEPKPTVISYPAASLFEDLKKKFAQQGEARANRLKWEIETTNESVELDPQLFQEALFDLIDNAFQFSPADATFVVKGEVRDGKFVITIREPKAADTSLATSAWGRAPLKNARHAHYGLGLNRVRAIVEAHGGELRADYQPQEKTLVTTILLPGPVAGT